MEFSTERLILMQLIKESEWVPDEAQHDKWPKNVLYKIGHIPVYEFEMPNIQENLVDHINGKNNSINLSLMSILSTFNLI